MFQQHLTGGVEEVERLVEDDNLWMTEECRYNTHFHLVACREIADELLVSEHLAVSEALVDFKTLLDLSLFDARNLAKEGKIFLGRQEVDEETVVDIGADMLFPRFAFSWIDGNSTHAHSLILRGGEHIGDMTIVGLQQIKEQAEERGLAGTVVTYESQDIPFVHCERGDIAGACLTKLLLEVVDSNHNYRFSR